MKIEKGRQKPRKSLRTILILWLLIFSVVPLAFVTGYSLVKFEQGIDQELSTRLLGNARQIGAIFSEYQASLVAESHQISDGPGADLLSGHQQLQPGPRGP